MATEILPNLWLGDINDSKNTLWIELNNIKAILNCTKDLPFTIDNIAKYRIKVHDNLEIQEIENLFDYLEPATEIIYKHLRNNEAVLVHCFAGKQRSASIVAGYLIKYGKLSVNSAIDCIKSKRNIAFCPGPNFKSALIQYHHKLNPSST
jgi:protein-tyrosine phosphatase